MTQLTQLPSNLDVIAFWALINNGPGAIPAWTLHRYTNIDVDAQAHHLDHREQATSYIPQFALQVQRAAGDHPSLVQAWVEVSPDMRELLISDPAYADYRSAA